MPFVGEMVFLKVLDFEVARKYSNYEYVGIRRLCDEIGSSALTACGRKSCFGFVGIGIKEISAYTN